MPNNNLDDLKNVLFKQIQDIDDPEEGQDLETALKKAKTIAELSTRIIEVSKVQVSAAKLMGRRNVPNSVIPQKSETNE